MMYCTISPWRCVSGVLFFFFLPSAGCAKIVVAPIIIETGKKLFFSFCFARKLKENPTAAACSLAVIASSIIERGKRAIDL